MQMLVVRCTDYFPLHIPGASLFPLASMPLILQYRGFHLPLKRTADSMNVLAFLFTKRNDDLKSSGHCTFEGISHKIMTSMLDALQSSVMWILYTSRCFDTTWNPLRCRPSIPPLQLLLNC